MKSGIVRWVLGLVITIFLQVQIEVVTTLTTASLYKITKDYIKLTGEEISTLLNSFSATKSELYGDVKLDNY